jgi:hypothetical protein
MLKAPPVVDDPREPPCRTRLNLNPDAAGGTINKCVLGGVRDEFHQYCSEIAPAKRLDCRSLRSGALHSLGERVSSATESLSASSAL